MRRFWLIPAEGRGDDLRSRIAIFQGCNREDSVILLITQQANKSREKLFKQGIVTLFGEQQTQKMVDSCP